ncbi:hypothetical protein OEZ74_26965, partial [Leclercia adecarboxylata]|uniref:hypothetical protein n=1 Tax=Leclercia adecarboxylata TaxID=83655 RepID=UPI00234C84A3
YNDDNNKLQVSSLKSLEESSPSSAPIIVSYSPMSRQDAWPTLSQSSSSSSSVTGKKTASAKESLNNPELNNDLENMIRESVLFKSILRVIDTYDNIKLISWTLVVSEVYLQPIFDKRCVCIMTE